MSAMVGIFMGRGLVDWNISSFTEYRQNYRQKVFFNVIQAVCHDVKSSSLFKIGIAYMLDSVSGRF